MPNYLKVCPLHSRSTGCWGFLGDYNPHSRLWEAPTGRKFCCSRAWPAAVCTTTRDLRRDPDGPRRKAESVASSPASGWGVSLILPAEELYLPRIFSKATVQGASGHFNCLGSGDAVSALTGRGQGNGFVGQEAAELLADYE